MDTLFTDRVVSLQMTSFKMFSQVFANHVKVVLVAAKFFHFDNHKRATVERGKSEEFKLKGHQHLVHGGRATSQFVPVNASDAVLVSG